MLSSLVACFVKRFRQAVQPLHHWRSLTPGCLSSNQPQLTFASRPPETKGLHQIVPRPKIARTNRRAAIWELCWYHV